MLNNLTNFLNLIKGKRIKTILEPKDLIPVGVKDTRFGADYKPSAITYENLKNQILANVPPPPPPVDPTVYAGRVVYVDSFNGNDTTGQINNFTKPFTSIYAAINHANSNGSPSASNRCLVYVRRGNYTNNYIYMLNYVDVYCEPGVVLEGQTLIRDNGAAITANFLGYAIISSWTSNTSPIMLSGASKMVIEFDYLTSQGAAIQISPTSTDNNFLIKGNYVYSSVSGAGFATTIRNNANVTFDIARAYESPHMIFQFKFFTGKALLNIPNTNLLSGNAFGGNFKSCIYLDSYGGEVTVNGNLNVPDTVYYGGNSAAITGWSAATTKLTVNGNVIGKLTHGTYFAAGGEITLNGDISSEQWPVIVSGSTKVHIKNSLILKKTTAAQGAISVGGSGTLYLNDVEIYSESETNLIDIQSNTASLFMKSVSAQGFNQPVGNSINVGAATPVIGLFNFITNKAVGAGVVNTYATPYILEPNLNVPKFLLL